MPITSVKDFVAGQVLTAAQMDDVNCGVKIFSDNAARDAAYGGTGERVLEAGETCYVTSLEELQVYDGSQWIGAAPTANRNVVINGAMQVAQRGTSTASITATGFYTADRWKAVLTTLGTWTQSVENDGPTGSGLRKSLKMLCTTTDASPAAGDVAVIQQVMEGQNVQQFLKGTASAKQFSLSFWVKANATGTYAVYLQDVDNTRAVAATYSVSASATWEKKTITFAADTTGVLDNNNASSLSVNFVLAAGTNWTSGTLATSWETLTLANLAVGQTNLAATTNNYWQISGMQLEAGSVATPFEFEDYGTTLAKCQRYYQRIQPNGTSKALGPIGRTASTTDAQFSIPYTVPMRAAPSALEQSGTATDYRISHGGISTQCSAVPTHGASTTELFGVVNTTVASGLTTGQAALFITDSVSSAGFLAWSAEL